MTELGLAQAQAVADRLAGPDGRGAAAVISSDLQRARTTAEIIAAALGVQTVVDPDLSEFDAGEWEGLAPEEIRARWAVEYAAWARSGAAAPGGESLAAAGRRWRRARDRILASYAGQTVVAVTHAGAIKGLIQAGLGAPEAAGRQISIDPASLSVLAWDSTGDANVLLVNDTSHLARVMAGSAG